MKLDTRAAMAAAASDDEDRLDGQPDEQEREEDPSALSTAKSRVRSRAVT